MTKRNQYWSINVTEKEFIKTIDKNDICNGDQVLMEAYDHLRLQWIGTDEYIRRFSHIFSGSISLNDLPAVATAIRNGLKEYSKILRVKDKDYYPHERLKVFLGGCFSSAQTVCRFDVIDNAGDTWSLKSDQPLSIWVFNRTHLTFKKSEITPTEFTRLLYEKIVPPNMKHAMRRFNHETAIMACCLAVGD